jgi:hypothetical protein
MEIKMSTQVVNGVHVFLIKLTYLWKNDMFCCVNYYFIQSMISVGDFVPTLTNTYYGSQGLINIWENN